MLSHDVMPFEEPDWFVPEVGRRFRQHVAAHLRAGSFMICNSDDSRRRLTRVARDLGLDQIDSATISLGSDGPTASLSGSELRRDEVGLADRYVLCVGTIEPRKNHAVLLDAWERLVGRHPELIAGGASLVIVGRLGWRSDEVARRLRRLRPMGVLWRRSADDAELAELYHGARAVVMPSLDEGLGVPVLEARRLAVPVVASERGGLVEALGEGGMLCDPHDAGSWERAIELVLTDEQFHQDLVHRSAADPPPTWDEAARQVWSLIRSRFRPI